MSETDLEHATFRAARAHERLGLTLTTLRDRLMPKNLARNFYEGAVDHGAAAAQAGADAVKARPAIAVGAAALVALLFARKPIVRAISGQEKPKRSPAKAIVAKPTIAKTRAETTAAKTKETPSRPGRSPTQRTRARTARPRKAKS